MKDVTVALELTLPEGVSDQEIQSFVEDAIGQHLLNRQREWFYNTDNVDWKDTSWRSIAWENLGILGIQAEMIDVIGIVDSGCEVTSYGDAIKAPNMRQWKMFQRV